MKNKFNSVAVILFSVFLLVFWCDNSNAAVRNNCSDAKNGKFNFSVAPAIGITVTHDWTLEPICPGCFRKWNCEEGSYFLEFIISGSTECWWDWSSPDNGKSNLIQIAGDNHAKLEGCWYELSELPVSEPKNWVPLFVTTAVGQPFLPTAGGMGIGGLRYYITYQSADCDASGTYTYTVTVNANYTCSALQ
jgi:hypothetical protein